VDTISVSTRQIPLQNLLPHLQTNTGEQLHVRARMMAAVAVPMKRPASTSKG
jgi:hypothetical protein